jgi:hypothetical protein
LSVVAVTDSLEGLMVIHMLHGLSKVIPQWVEDRNNDLRQSLQRNPGRALANCHVSDLLCPMFGERFSFEEFNAVFAFAKSAVDWPATAGLKQLGETMFKGEWWARSK